MGSMVVDLSMYKDTIKSMLYDNGLCKYMDYSKINFDELKDGEKPKEFEPVASLTIDFGDGKLTITGKACWESLEKNE